MYDLIKLPSLKLKIIAYPFLMGMLFFSCEKDKELETVLMQQKEETIMPTEDFYSFGTKLENPYTVENMQRAFENIRKQSKSFLEGKSSEDVIETTHYYLRFLPRDDFEKSTLQEEDLTLFDMPLDYEFPEGDGPVFHDPNIPTTDVSWQYTVVPTTFDFKEYKHEILAKLFLDNDPEDESSTLKNGLNENEWLVLENEALRITGNLDDQTEKENGLTAKKKWYPDGYIKYEDNTTSPSRIIPLQGVQVVVKRWFKWSTKFTTATGYFKARKFRSKKVKVAIKWERADFDIRVGSYGQAWYNFVALKRGRKWNLTIRKSWTPSNWHWASIHRGAMEYFYNNQAYGIRRPFSKQFLSPRLHIAGKNKSGRSHYFTFKKIYWAAPVVIYSSGNNGTVYNSRKIFATTVHELAHVSHWEIGYSTGQYVIDYLADDPFLPESWATGVEHTVINRVYPASLVGSANFPYDRNRQDWTLQKIQTDSDGYTPIVIDMIDNFNQSSKNSSRPNDRVSGYTLGQLEDALPSSYGNWWKWRNRIRSMYNNPAENAELDYLFREYR